MSKNLKLWISSMECAGIAEAGGVKNVTFSLCKEFSLLQNDVTLFIPVFKCSSFSNIINLNDDYIKNVVIKHCQKDEIVSFSTGICKDGNFKVVFINHPSFSEKENIYTYTENEQKKNPQNIKGTGYRDSLFMDSLFAKCIVKYLEYTNKEDFPDIIHCQDASTALVPVFLRQNNFSKIKTVVTIHNAGPAYHHNFSCLDEARYYTELSDDILLEAGNGGRIEPFLLASNAGAFLTTVSEKYAEELINPEFESQTEGLSTIFAEKKIKITGITNGIDYDRYNPTDCSVSTLPFSFNPEKKDVGGKFQCRNHLLKMISKKNEVSNIKIFGNFEDSFDNVDIKKNVYICYQGRITTQKGISVLIESIPYILNNFENIRFLITGQGEYSIENKLTQLTKDFYGKVVFINGYDRKIARLTVAACDFIVLPSFFEPCGLEDFIAQIYGTIPVAHKTGGLTKIINNKTGFLYSENDSKSLIAKLSEVITIKNINQKIIDKMISDASTYVHKNYEWNLVIKNKYLKFFKEILKIL